MRSNKLIIVLAAIFALLAAFMAYYLINNAQEAAIRQQYVDVAAAIQDIPANTAITPAMLEMKRFPKDLQTGKEITDLNNAVGKISPVAVGRGEYLLDNRLVKPGEGTDRLSYKVPDGMRAMSIPVDVVKGVSNMIKIGDRVDIIAVVPPQSASPEAKSVLILQNIEILAVGSLYKETAAPEQNAEAATVTVAVDPQSALKLKMALQGTDIALALRPASDKNMVNPTPVTITQF